MGAATAAVEVLRRVVQVPCRFPTTFIANPYVFAVIAILLCCCSISNIHAIPCLDPNCAHRTALLAIQLAVASCMLPQLVVGR